MTRNQEIGAEGFILGWDSCRTWMCKQYNIDEAKVLADESIDLL